MDIHHVAEYAAMAVGCASILVTTLEKITGITPLDADNLNIPELKRLFAKAQKVIAMLGFHPRRQK